MNRKILDIVLRVPYGLNMTQVEWDALSAGEKQRVLARLQAWNSNPPHMRWVN